MNSSDGLEGFELSDELLHSITGGVLDPATKAVLDNALAALKQKDVSMDRALEIFSLTDDAQKREDTLAYIKEVWDTI